MARFNPNIFHEKTQEERLEFGDYCKKVLQLMPYAKHPGWIASYVLDCMQQSSMESIFGPMSDFANLLWDFLENTPISNYPEVFFEKRLLDEACCFSIPLDNLPPYLQEIACESFMGYYQWNDSGDEVDTNEDEDEDEDEELGHWYASKNRNDAHEDKKKHSKASCYHHAGSNNTSKQGRKRHLAKKLRKAFDIPSGKSGYKKMWNSDYIF